MREQFDVHPDTLSGHGAAVVALAPELEGVESEVRAQRLSPAPVSVWSELGVFSDVWTDALNAIGGALDYFGRSPLTRPGRMPWPILQRRKVFRVRRR